MPEYEPANQQAADDASSISSWLSGSLWSLASSVVNIASSILPNQRYDPVQQQPDDNSSIASGEQDNQVISAARNVNTSERWSHSQTGVTSMTRQPNRDVNDHQPSDSEHPSKTGIRIRRLLWWLRDFKVFLFSITDSRRAKLVNWIILALISVLYYLIFTSVTVHKGVTEGVLSAVCLVLVTYHRIQAFRVFVPLTQCPQFNHLGRRTKSLFWSWVANHVAHFVFEVLLNLDYWVGCLNVIWSTVIGCTVVMSYGFTIVTTLCALDNKELLLINFPIPTFGDYFKTPLMPIITLLSWIVLVHVAYDNDTFFIYGVLLSAYLWLPATTR